MTEQAWKRCDHPPNCVAETLESVPHIHTQDFLSRSVVAVLSRLDVVLGRRARRTCRLAPKGADSGVI